MNIPIRCLHEIESCRTINRNLDSIKLANNDPYRNVMVLTEFLSRRSTATVGHAGGDQYFDSILNCIKPKSIFRWSKSKRHDDTDRYSSDSLKVNVGDLADAEELKKISTSVRICDEQNSENIIEDFHILNGFRQHSKEILAIVNQQSNLFNYGEKDSGRKLLSIAAEAGWYEGVVFLLNRGVNINETDHENRTALINCLTSTNTNIVKVLVKKPECNLDIQTLTGHTATHYAVMMNVRDSFFFRF
ncbi:unnamed protein product [Rotaria socialis]|uniref:ANK_REP_REGION domain-containing protein n=1 Tax=Rotaria socialis TaxID=392032 RepID=A0A817VMR7_9BILA|nr:unnamed protein product [Rotaria socialis]